MWKRKKKPVEPEPNLLDLTPRRQLEWEKLDETKEQRVALLVPKFTHPFWVKHLMPRLKKPIIRVKLDAYGSHLWCCCDGSSTVEEIGEKMKDRFGDNIEPLYERMGLFINRLEREQWLALEE